MYCISVRLSAQAVACGHVREKDLLGVLAVPMLVEYNCKSSVVFPPKCIVGRSLSTYLSAGVLVEQAFVREVPCAEVGVTRAVVQYTVRKYDAGVEASGSRCVWKHGGLVVGHTLHAPRCLVQFFRPGEERVRKVDEGGAYRTC